MSVTENLSEMSKLNLGELEASPELLEAIDAADASFSKEGEVSVDEGRRILARSM